MLIELRDVRKSYNVGRPSEAEVLHDITLQVRRGEFIALMGPSGSGKSTLLNILGLLESMTSGSYRLDGEAVQGLQDAALTLRRRRTLGFVFQFHHLLPAFSALENVTLPALMAEGRVSTTHRDHARSRWWNWKTKPSVRRRRKVSAASSSPCTASPSSR